MDQWEWAFNLARRCSITCLSKVRWQSSNEKWHSRPHIMAKPILTKRESQMIQRSKQLAKRRSRATVDLTSMKVVRCASTILKVKYSLTFRQKTCHDLFEWTTSTTKSKWSLRWPWLCTTTSEATYMSSQNSTLTNRVWSRWHLPVQDSWTQKGLWPCN